MKSYGHTTIGKGTAFLISFPEDAAYRYISTWLHETTVPQALAECERIALERGYTKWEITLRITEEITQQEEVK